LGRQIEDAVTAFGTGIDEAVKRITTTYEARGMVATVTEPPPTPGLRREGSRGVEKGNP
jgi:hypothetical protein